MNGVTFEQDGLWAFKTFASFLPNKNHMMKHDFEWNSISPNYQDLNKVHRTNSQIMATQPTELSNGNYNAILGWGISSTDAYCDVGKDGEFESWFTFKGQVTIYGVQSVSQSSIDTGTKLTGSIEVINETRSN